MKTESCAWPPQLAVDVEIAEQRDGDRAAFIVGSAATGRYLLLREVEHRVLQLLAGDLAAAEICAEFQRRHGGALRLPMLTKFLARLEASGILAGERVADPRPQQLRTEFYTRFCLCNPDALFARVVSVFGWVWTPPFFVVSLLLLLAAAWLALLNGAEVVQYGGYILREHFVAVVVAGLLVGVTHEFAHGLTCKAFGGRATEVGVLIIYYLLPAFYCNVSGLHLIPQRGRRLWVIAAGVYWQLLVGAMALLAWRVLAPYTLLADMAFSLFCGSLLDVAFNGNPLIKLDGYYFLSQWLRLPNLMERAREWWRHIVFGAQTSARFSRREQMILAVFGLLSFVYTLALRCFLVIWLGGYLTDWWGLPGLLGTLALALFYARRPLAQAIMTAVSALRTSLGGTMTIQIKAKDSDPTETEPKPSRWRRRLVLAALILSLAVILCLPWNASVGAYGTLLVVPGQEAIIRAPESATLLELRVRPGDATTAGAVLGRMGNLELEEQLAATQAELERAQADADRLRGAVRAREEAIARAEVNLRQRQSNYDESEAEQRQIAARERAAANLSQLTASVAPLAPPAGENRAVSYPAALAALQSEADLRQAKLAEARLQLDRARQLHAQGITPRSELDKAETMAATLSLEVAAALIEHRRRHIGLTTEMQLAISDVGAEQLQTVKLQSEWRAASSLLVTLTQRRALLQRRLAQFALVTPHAGAVFGEELPRLVGQYFPKGAEICRVADTRTLLARIQMSEREIGDVRVGHPVRLKVSAYPDQIFRGRVTKIGGESESDAQPQVRYRVELVIENPDDLLRPGMTAFARIDLGRWRIGAILLHKLKQALRPELWMV
jgi:multidrug efflux pump subunit AcrA (membrane-fusion protein)